MTQAVRRLNRRSIALGLALAPAACVTRAPAHDPFVVDQLLADVRRYVTFGDHRSGSPTDDATAEWVRTRLNGLNYEIERTLIPVETALNPFARLSVGESSFECFIQARAPEHVWGTHISGPLARATEVAGLNGAIAILDSAAPAGAYWPSSRDAPVHALAQAGAKALIVTVEGNGSVFAYNRDASDPAFPIPVLIVDESAHRVLLAQSQHIQNTRIVFPSGPTRQNTSLVTGVKQGAGPWVVVSTPLTGWFTCGAERGPGVALFLALASALKTAHRPVMMIAAGGHEIGHLGMHHALQHIAPPPNEVGLWLHLGSSIATLADVGAPRLHESQSIFVTPALDAEARSIFNYEEPPLTRANAQSPGETGQVIARGYTRVLGLAGAHTDFHTPLDRGDLVSGRVLSALGASLLRLSQGR